MKKTFILILCALALAAWLLYIWLNTPNSAQKATHIATVCNVIKQNHDFSNEAELLKQVQFTFGNSTPSYALHPQKFYSAYAGKIAGQYFRLSAAEKTQAQHNFEKCKRLLSQ